MKKICVINLTFLLCIYGFSFSKEQKGNIYIDGFKRSFLVHLPKKRQNKPPLVIVLHGGMGKGRGIAKLTRFSQLSDRKGFIVIYPDAIKGHWNDGRECHLFYSHRFNVNDVKFISKLIDYATAEFKADPEKIFVVGMSNGGMMAYRIACELSDKVKAIAAVAATMPAHIVKQCKPQRPVSILVIHGRKDPIVPWNGGHVLFDKLKFGKVLSVKETVSFWTKQNHCEITKFKYLPDKTEDDTRVWAKNYKCPSGVRVTLYGIDGGGHTWPCSFSYLSETIVGKTSHDINATEVIWSFFKSISFP